MKTVLAMLNSVSGCLCLLQRDAAVKQHFHAALVADADHQRVGQFGFEHPHQRERGFIIKLVGGFVEKQNLRAGGKGAGEAEPLLFAT